MKSIYDSEYKNFTGWKKSIIKANQESSGNNLFDLMTQTNSLLYTTFIP